MHAQPSTQLDSSAIDSSAHTESVATCAIEYVLSNFADEIDLDALAASAGMSRFNFCRRFQRECGVSPIRWLWNFRTILASEFIRLDPAWSLTDIAFSCGFSSSAHFSRAFKQMFSLSPSAFRRKARISAAGAQPNQKFDALFTDNQSLVAAAARAAMPVAIHAVV